MKTISNTRTNRRLGPAAAPQPNCIPRTTAPDEPVGVQQLIDMSHRTPDDSQPAVFSTTGFSDPVQAGTSFNSSAIQTPRPSGYTVSSPRHSSADRCHPISPEIAPDDVGPIEASQQSRRTLESRHPPIEDPTGELEPAEEPLSVAEALEILDQLFLNCQRIMSDSACQQGVGFVRDLGHEVDAFRTRLMADLPDVTSPARTFIARMDRLTPDQARMLRNWQTVLQDWQASAVSAESEPVDESLASRHADELTAEVWNRDVDIEHLVRQQFRDECDAGDSGDLSDQAIVDQLFDSDEDWDDEPFDEDPVLEELLDEAEDEDWDEGLYENLVRSLEDFDCGDLDVA